MHTEATDAFDIGRESEKTREMYGDTTLGRQFLIARRLAERGVRFINIYNEGWDAHSDVAGNVKNNCAKTDKASAALVKDLKRRGLLDSTLVVWGGEFGRTPMVEASVSLGRSQGRDHHPHGFSVFFAGAGIQSGIVHGETDELGFHAIEPAHYVTDLHATVLHLLGLDPRKLEVPGRKRLEIDHGQLIKGILA